MRARMICSHCKKEFTCNVHCEGGKARVKAGEAIIDCYCDKCYEKELKTKYQKNCDLMNYADEKVIFT